MLAVEIPEPVIVLPPIIAPVLLTKHDDRAGEREEIKGSKLLKVLGVTAFPGMVGIDRLADLLGPFISQRPKVNTLRPGRERHQNREEEQVQWTR